MFFKDLPIEERSQIFILLVEKIKDLEEKHNIKVIFSCIGGSWQQGTAIEGSDLDCKIVFRANEGLFKRIENFDFKIELPTELAKFDKFEGQALEVKSFIKAACACNPTILEILFAEGGLGNLEGLQYLLQQQVLSKKIYYSYLGYAKSQLNKIQNHKEWITQELIPPERKDFDIELSEEASNRLFTTFTSYIEYLVTQTYPMYHGTSNEEKYVILKSYLSLLSLMKEENLIEIKDDLLAKMLEENMYLVNDYVKQVTESQFFLDRNFMALIQKEKAYRKAKAEYASRKHWLEERNERRKETEIKYGYDIKHATHLIRLLLTCKIILKKARYPNHEELSEMAPELMKIKTGQVSYEDLMTQSNNLLAELEELKNTTTLPDRINETVIEEGYRKWMLQ